MTILTVLFEVDDQVLFALELVSKFLSLHVAEGTLLGFGDVVAFHIFYRWIFKINKPLI